MQREMATLQERKGKREAKENQRKFVAKKTETRSPKTITKKKPSSPEGFQRHVTLRRKGPYPLLPKPNIKLNQKIQVAEARVPATTRCYTPAANQERKSPREQEEKDREERKQKAANIHIIGPTFHNMTYFHII